MMVISFLVNMKVGNLVRQLSVKLISKGSRVCLIKENGISYILLEERVSRVRRVHYPKESGMIRIKLWSRSNSYKFMQVPTYSGNISTWLNLKESYLSVLLEKSDAGMTET